MVSFGAVSPMLTGMGLLTGNQSLLSAALWTESALGIFIIGTLVILFFAALLILGMKAYFNFQKAMFVVAMAGFILGVIVMAATSQGEFISKFNHFMSAFTEESDAYHTIIKTAEQEGYSWAPFSTLATLKLTIWVYLSMGYCVLSSSFAGEIKNVKKSQPIGMASGVLVAGAIYILWSTFGQSAFGADFIRAISYLDMNAPQASIFPTMPWLSLFAGLVAPNIILSLIIFLGFFAMSLLLPAVCMVYSSRGILAWSIDRLTPDKLGEVNEKYHSPVNTILVVTIGGIIFNAMYAFAGDTPILVNILMWAIFAMTFSFGATTLVGAFFPFYKKHFYKGSAGDINIAGIPLMTICGIIASIYIGSMIYWFATEPYVGTNSPEAIAVIILVFVVGAIFYYAFKSWRRKQDIDVELAYREIPIE
jgi:amino acid transporter